MAESKAALRVLQALLTGGSVPPLPPGVGAEEVVARARSQGVSGLLLKAAEADPSSWAGPLAGDLAAERRGALVRTLGQVALAGRVLGLLAERGIRALPLKGVALAETVYDVESDRPMSDVDVLALERWPEAVSILKDTGFEEFARGDHAWAFKAPASGTLLELHRSVSSCPGLFPLDADAVWARSRPGRGQLDRLSSPEDLLVQLALHAAFQHGLVLSLVQWLDFRQVLEREEVDAARLARVAEEARAATPLAASLLVAEAVAGAPLPPVVHETVLSPLPRGLRQWLEPRLGDPLVFVAPTPPSLGRVRWELMAGRRVELLWRTLVVPGGPEGAQPVLSRAAAAVGRGLRLARQQVAPPEGPAPGTRDLAAPEVPFREELLRECLAEFPWVRLTVTGACMEPALADGEKVHLVPPSRRPPRVGDVVLARGPEGLRLHRLVWGPPLAWPGSRWRTKADRGRLLDPPLEPADVLASVARIEPRPDTVVRRPGRALMSLARGVLARLRLGVRAAEAVP
jgi:hypothetical protein